MANFQVLLATLNGARFLQEQIDSLARQTVDTLHVLASDDGSQDGTLDILRAAQAGWTKGRFEIIGGPRRGFAGNFRHLIEQTDGTGDFFAFCDQDDVWMPDKLADATEFCTAPGVRVFASRTILIDAGGAVIGLSPLPRRPASFGNAILQSIAGGNTMVMNRAAHALLKLTSHHIGTLAHDRWLYLIATGSGGRFHYSPRPTVMYRQHENNTLGAKPRSVRAAHFWRFDRGKVDQLRKSIAAQLDALESCRGHLTTECSEMFDSYSSANKSGSLIKRIPAIRKSGIYKNTRMGQLGLWLDCICRIR